MRRTLGTALLLAAFLPAAALAQESRRNADKEPEKNAGRPEIELKATPLIVFSPAKVTVRAEFKGGQTDYEPFYCATVVWDWDDGTTSEYTPDCPPYEAGVSAIRRYLSNTHVFQTAGRYNVRLRLKKGDKVVGGATTLVQVRGGLRDMTDPMR